MKRRQALRAGLAGLGAITGLAVAGCAPDGSQVPLSTAGRAGSDGPMPETITYGDDPSQFGELTVPNGAGPYPVVVVIHGGFWSSSYDLQLGRPLADDLVAHGVAAWNIEYRRVGRGRGAGGGWPATGADVAAAVDKLGALHRSELDLDRVVALGHSAGGQLAGWLGGRTNPSVAVSGIVSQAGCLDLVGAAHADLGNGATQRLLGGEPEKIPAVYAAASPLARLPMQTPVVCVHGTKDYNVPLQQSETFVDAAADAGSVATLKRIDGADHFDLITVGRPGWSVCRAETLRLLGR